MSKAIQQRHHRGSDRIYVRKSPLTGSSWSKGLWKVVNKGGGTGGRAHLQDWVVAGKTGTAQATERGHEENVAWFACFAPFDHPKHIVVVMVQGASGHGGEVAGPIATRILERTLAQDEGKFDMKVAWLT